MEIMRFRKFIKYYLLGESVKEIELNRILDKVSKKRGLLDKEKKFLDLYNSTSDESIKDYMYLSKNETYIKIKKIMELGKVVICDLSDRNGVIGLAIDSVENYFSDETCVVKMKGGETCKLDDKFLYNLIYSNRKDVYSLQIQGEYYEKIPIKND